MTKIARPVALPSTHLPLSAREGSPEVPLWSRTKPQRLEDEISEILSLAFLVGGGPEPPAQKRNPQKEGKGLEMDVSCSPCPLSTWLPAVPRGLDPATEGCWTLALPPARCTQAAPLEPCRPITSTHSAPALENQLWLCGPLGTGDTPSGTVEST